MDAIFTFHSIDASGSVLSYSPDDLRRLVEGLLEDGVRLVDPAELLAPAAPGDQGPHRAALTFDDGIVSVHRNAAPILTELGVPAVLYPVSEWVGRDNGWPGQPPDAPRYELMSWDALRELVAAGFSIGSHTANHVRLDGNAPVDWEVELEGSRARLEDELGVEVRHFAYPYGSYCAESVRRAFALFDTCVTTDLAFTRPGISAGMLPRIDTYYLRDPARRQPIFGAATRRYIKVRAFGRRVRSALDRP